jgi:predicted RNA-binding Zn-ribbon protein involved in translation (DUF1610 family)
MSKRPGLIGYYPCPRCGERVDLAADKAEHRDHQLNCVKCGDWEHSACTHTEEEEN